MMAPLPALMNIRRVTAMVDSSVVARVSWKSYQNSTANAEYDLAGGIMGLASGAPAFLMPQVAVIGGGLAGLASVVALGSAGFEVVIYEARNFLGGRATSWPVGGE